MSLAPTVGRFVMLFYACFLAAGTVADKLYQPAIGPTRNTEAQDALDATVPNPEAICEPIGFIETILSSKLYPITASDSMEIAATLSGGDMFMIPTSYVDTTFSPEDGTYVQKRWFYADGPYDNDVDTTFSVEDGELINKLVEAEAGPELLQISCAIKTSCSMDAI